MLVAGFHRACPSTTLDENVCQLLLSQLYEKQCVAVNPK